MLWRFDLLLLFILRIALNGYQFNLIGFVGVNLDNLVELAWLKLMGLILDFYLATLARQNRTA